MKRIRQIFTLRESVLSELRSYCDKTGLTMSGIVDQSVEKFLKAAKKEESQNENQK